MASAGGVWLAEVWGEEMSAVMVVAEMGPKLSLDIGLVVVLVGEVMGRTVETRDKEVTGESGVIVEILSGGGGVATADDAIEVSEV